MDMVISAFRISDVKAQGPGSVQREDATGIGWSPSRVRKTTVGAGIGVASSNNITR